MRGKIVGIEAGSGLMRDAANAVKQYGLKLQLVEGSTAAMTAALKSAIDRGPVRILSTDGEFHSFRRQAQRWVEAGEVELTLVETERPDFAERFLATARSGAYDLIFVNGSVEEVPASLLGQLAEGGRLVTVEGYGNAARAKVFVSERGAVSENVFFNASVKPLPGFAKLREFVF